MRVDSLLTIVGCSSWRNVKAVILAPVDMCIYIIALWPRERPEITRRLGLLVVSYRNSQGQQRLGNGNIGYRVVDSSFVSVDSLKGR